MNGTAFVYGYLAGVIMGLLGMVLGSALRPLIGKTPRPVTWGDAAFLLAYGLPLALAWGWMW